MKNLKFMLSLLSFTIAVFIMTGCGDSTVKKDTYTNYQALVTPQWVNELINGNNPETYPGNGYVIVCTSWWPRADTGVTTTNGEGSGFANTGHIPGAIFLDTYSVETGPNCEYEGYTSPDESHTKPLPVLQKLFASMGITKDKTVVVYSDDVISMMSAGRIAWTMLYAGVDDVRIMNGGYSAWTAAGYNIETGTVSWTVEASFGVSPGNTEFMATSENLYAVIDGTDTNSVIVDDRSYNEFYGIDNSYYGWFDNVGHIPEAKWIGDWKKIVTADNHSFISLDDIEYNWRQLGFTPDKKMNFYCGGGARSALYTFCAYIMGWPAANYEGGWYLWSTKDGYATVDETP